MQNLFDLVKSDLHTGMGRTSISCNLPIKIVLNHDNLLTAIRVGLQDTLDCRVGHLALSTGNVPCVTNHELEVVVRVDAGAHVLVVVLELFNRHDLITLVGLPHGHEVRKNFITSLASTLEIRVETDIVCNADIFNGDLAGTILIKDTIGLMNHIKTTLVKLPTDGAQKLIKGQHAILVSIEMLNNLGDLDL